MASPGSTCTVNAIVQRLKRQSLQTPANDEVPLPRSAENSRSVVEYGFKSRAGRFKAGKPANKDASLEPPAADENVGPDSPLALPVDRRARGIKRDETSPPKLAANLVPRPIHSHGLPSMSVRSYPARGGPVANSAPSPSRYHDPPVLRPHRSPPLAPPVKRFCRSLTEGLPRPTPLRPVDCTAPSAAASASLDHLQGLVGIRRATGRAFRRSCGDSFDSSFCSSHSSFRRWTGPSASAASSGYCGSSFSDGPVEPELEALAPLAPLAAANPALTREKCDGEAVYRLVQGRYVRDPTMTRRDFFHGGRSFLCGLPELRQRAELSPNRSLTPSSPRVFAPSPLVATARDSCQSPDSGLSKEAARDKAEAEEDDEEEEDEADVTLMSDSRWSSPCGLADLDLDSMEKDDSWMP